MDFIQGIADEKLKKKLNDHHVFLVFIKKRLIQPISSRDFNIIGVCEIFHIDPKILLILVSKGILTNSSKVSSEPRYGWGGIEITEKMLMGVVRELDSTHEDKEELKQITQEIPESKQHTVSNQNEQQSFSKQEEDSNILKLIKDKELQKNGEEKYDQVFDNSVTNTFSHIDHNNRTFKKWTEYELQFLRENYNKRPEYIAEQLNRTISSVKNAKSVMKRTGNLTIIPGQRYVSEEKVIDWHEELWSEIELEHIIIIWDINKINSAVNYLNSYKQNSELSEDQLFDCEFKLEALENEIKRRKDNNIIQKNEIKQDKFQKENFVVTEKSQPFNKNSQWTLEELNFLIDMYLKGEDPIDMAVALGRTAMAVYKMRSRIMTGDFGQELRDKLLSQVDAPITEEDIAKAQITVDETIESKHMVEDDQKKQTTHSDNGKMQLVDEEVIIQDNSFLDKGLKRALKELTPPLQDNLTAKEKKQSKKAVKKFSLFWGLIKWESEQ